MIDGWKFEFQRTTRGCFKRLGLSVQCGLSKMGSEYRDTRSKRTLWVSVLVLAWEFEVSLHLKLGVNRWQDHAATPGEGK